MNHIMLSCALLASSAAVANAQPVFSQSFSPDNGIISEGVAGGFFDQRIADDFTVGSNTSVNAVRFWGSEENFFTPDFPGNIAGARIEIFTDAGGVPGTSIFNENIDIANIATADTGADFPLGQSIFRFDASLSSAVSLTAGVQYWFSVGALPVTDFANDDSFFWATSLDGNNISAEQVPVDGLWAARDLDFAFELIPAPGSVGLLAFGALAATRRRR